MPFASPVISQDHCGGSQAIRTNLGRSLRTHACSWGIRTLWQSGPGATGLQAATSERDASQPPMAIEERRRRRRRSFPAASPPPNMAPWVADSLVAGTRRGLAIELPLQFLDFFLEAGVLTHLLVDLADRMQHRGVIAITEAAPDFGQRPRRQVLGQIHADLPWAHDRAVPALGQDVLLGDRVVPRDNAQDVLNLYAPRLDPLHQITDDGLGDIERDRSMHQLPSEIQAIDGTFQFTATLGQFVGQQLYHRIGDFKGRIRGLLLLRPLLKDLEAQRRIERANLGDEPALQARAHAIVEALELRWGPGRSDHHLLAAIEQRIDDVLELLLGLLPAHELEVVDQQHVDGAELVLESQGVLALDGLDELIAEALGRQVERLGLALALHLPSDGVLEVRLTEPDVGMQIERIEGPVVGQHGLGNLRGGRVRHAVGRTDDKAVEGIAWVERGAFKAAGMRAAEQGRPRTGCGPPLVARVRCRHRAWLRRRLPSGLAHPRLAHDNVDAFRALEFGRATLKQIVGVMRLDPALQELHRHRGNNQAAVEAVEL